MPRDGWDATGKAVEATPALPTKMTFADAVLRVGWIAALVCGVLFSMGGSRAVAAPAPAWMVSSVATPTNFAPGDAAGDYSYEVTALNIGGAATNGSPIEIVDDLPAGLEVQKVELPLVRNGASSDFGPELCETEGLPDLATVTCTVPTEFEPPLPPSADEPSLLYPYEAIRLVIRVSPVAIAEGEMLANRVEVQGGGAPAASLTAENPVAAADAPAGFAEFQASVTGEDGQPADQAGSHPFHYVFGFALNTRRPPPGSTARLAPAGGDTKDIRIAMPPGLVDDPGAATRCPLQQFNTVQTVNPAPGATVTQNQCPDGSAVGLLLSRQIEGVSGIAAYPLYNLVPPPGMPAQLGFQVVGLPFFIDTEVRTGGDYGITASLQNLTQGKRLTAATVVLWGTPADAVHNPVRGHCLGPGVPLRLSLGTCAPGIPSQPFIRLPTSCLSPLGTGAALDTWTLPGVFRAALAPGPTPTLCAAPPFAPSVAALPSQAAADSPSGFRFDLHLPQEDEGPGPATADLREIVLRLPEGLVVNPSAANGLAGCSADQVALAAAAPAHCPPASKLGTVAIETPLLDQGLEGSLYLARPEDNPFGSLFALYLVAADPQSGVTVKLAGEVDADPVSGRLTARFPDAPQLPVEDVAVELFSGPGALLRTPLACGTHEVRTELKPWSSPESGPDAVLASPFAIATAPGGGSCGEGGGSGLDLQAGSLSPRAGAYSPFAFELRREDGSPALASVDASLPPGLLARLAGIPYCPDAAIVAAGAASGAAELAAPSCPAASLVGTATATAGAGPQPYYLGTGRAYLSGPHDGAPLSLAVLVPALAGPFDLGTVALRLALHVDPQTAQLRVAGERLPTILSGVPLDLRSLRLELDRPEFTLNPTSCEKTSVGATVGTIPGAETALAERFQVGGCADLGFKPRIGLRFAGATGRNGHPTVTATLRPRRGDANLRGAKILLPGRILLDQRRIRGVCTRAEFGAGACPADSAYGRVRAWSPLLDRPLRGKLFLRESSTRYPDLAADLRGQIRIALSGRLSTPNVRIQAGFDRLPDVPFSRLELILNGGRRGFLVDGRSLCRGRLATMVELSSQSGRVRRDHIRAKASCDAAAAPGDRAP